MRVSVQQAPFEIGKEVDAFSKNVAGSGAIVTFSGVVRDVEPGLQSMTIEHYPGMTERALTDIAETAISRWSLQDCLIIHRYGTLGPGDQIMMVATAATHRKAAFESAEFLMDYLKSRAPFWKKELTAKGENWVAAQDTDEAALDRWTP
ncbi:MAG: molybdenum cofactor biosynthesis protein MoaE [Pseudomonadota bacterium]